MVGVLTAIIATSCGEPELNNLANTRLLVKTPVAGARCAVWDINDDYTMPDAPIGEATTKGDGTFEMELGVVDREVLIECFGGSFVETVSGESVTLDSTARWAAMVTRLAFNEERTVMVSALTTMAEALATARLARGDKEGNFLDAHERALQLVGEHFGDIDPVTTIPIDPTANSASTLTADVRHGLVLVALSELAERIRVESAVTANVVNSYVLMAAMVADVGSSEALFDGASDGGPVAIGSCPQPSVCTDEACSTVCDIGPRTAREYLATSLADFIESAQNRTGLTAADVSEVMSKIATNTEPELFGDAPIVSEGPELVLWTDGFVLDGGIWWTTNDAPTLFGEASAADGDTVRVEVSVNGGAAMPAQFISSSVWIAQIPGLAVAPQTNSVVVAAIDGIGLRTQRTLEMRVDDTPATVEFLTTSVTDERDDQITFGTGVTHTHQGSPVDLGGTTCPDVYKHAYLMDQAGDTNPIEFKFRVTDVGIGIDATSVQYRVRKQGAATWLIGWMAPDTTTPITAGVEATARMSPSVVAALGTDEAMYEIAIRGADKLGQAVEPTACWNHHPMGRPLQVTNERSAGPIAGDDPDLARHRLGARQLGQNNIAPLLAPSSSAANQPAALMSFDVQNFHDVPVIFEVASGASVLPAISGTKTWKKGYVEFDTYLNAACPGGPTTGNCSQVWPPFTTELGTDEPVDINAPIDTVLMFDIANPTTPVSPCAGCAPNRFAIAANSTYRVMLSSRKLQRLYPGPGVTSYDGPYTEYLIYDISGMPYFMTGKYLGPFLYCLGTPYSSNGTWYCPETYEYRTFLALEKLTLSLTATDFKPWMAPAVTATATAHQVSALVVYEPPANYTWNTNDMVP